MRLDIGGIIDAFPEYEVAAIVVRALEVQPERPAGLEAFVEEVRAAAGNAYGGLELADIHPGHQRDDMLDGCDRVPTAMAAFSPGGVNGFRHPAAECEHEQLDDRQDASKADRRRRDDHRAAIGDEFLENASDQRGKARRQNNKEECEIR